MAIQLDILLKRPNKIYHEGETICGIISIKTPTEIKHEGISLSIEGFVDLQISSQNVGTFDAFYNSVKPIQLMLFNLDIARPGRLPSGRTEISFEAPVKPLTNKVLYESYHGVFINVQYLLKALIQRNFLNKDVRKSLEFIVENRPRTDTIMTKVDKFVINQNTLANVNDCSNIPKFHIIGTIDSVICSILKPFKGELKIEHSDIPIKSIDVQLVRVETCGCAEGFSKDCTEIQNIQIAEGNVATGISIPIFMVFPRLFSCSTTKTANFKIEFEVNISIVFEDEHLVTENFPITIIR
ncbi:vacuolar protein sorting-associated protein 26C [Daktulosphaira vitifoliae]|uniref:vacuolar protein sorting-associated protein 26C n=1 Tax=Daktulosphaira vitifoliae TaxID=58002 RepID=UPI0021A98DB8|nr:vacuolar protein sorting-associated protein 26C [Daktulosphaira vitifoliae]